MELNLVLDDKSLALVIDWLWELGGDGVVSSGILDDEALVALHTLKNMWLLNSPLADVCPLLVNIRSLHILLGMGWLPSLLPIVGELLEEVRLDIGWLQICQYIVSVELV